MPHPLLLIPTRAELSCSTNVFLPLNSLSISTLGLISPLSCSSDDFTGYFEGSRAAFPGCQWFQMFLGLAFRAFVVVLWLFSETEAPWEMFWEVASERYCLGANVPVCSYKIAMFPLSQKQLGPYLWRVNGVGL